MNISRVAKTTINNAERLIKKMPIEVIVAVENKSGKVAFIKQGGEHAVELGKEDIAKLKKFNQSLIIGHDHPLGLPLSPNDTFLAFETKAKEVRAVTPEGKIFLMELPKKLTNEMILNGLKMSMHFIRFLPKLEESGKMATKADYIKFCKFMQLRIKKAVPGVRFRTLLLDQKPSVIATA